MPARRPALQMAANNPALRLFNIEQSPEAATILAALYGRL
jgi:hypothetical protein